MNFKKLITFFTCFAILIAGYFQVSIINGNKDNQLGGSNEQMNTILVNIFISGEVHTEGLFIVSTSSTVYDIVYENAGGFTSLAAINCINIYSTIENMFDISENILYLIIPSYDNPACSVASEGNEIVNGLININTASSELLQTINGIGKATAENIITYRNNNGYFKKIEDIVNVSGIGNSKYESIKNYITV